MAQAQRLGRLAVYFLGLVVVIVTTLSSQTNAAIRRSPVAACGVENHYIYDVNSRELTIVSFSTTGVPLGTGSVTLEGFPVGARRADVLPWGSSTTSNCVVVVGVDKGAAGYEIVLVPMDENNAFSTPPPLAKYVELGVANVTAIAVDETTSPRSLVLAFTLPDEPGVQTRSGLMRVYPEQGIPRIVQLGTIYGLASTIRVDTYGHIVAGIEEVFPASAR